MRAVHLVMMGGLVAMLATQGCMVHPKRLSQQEVDSRIRQDMRLIEEGQEKVAAPVTLDEAVARALLFNLDHRLKLMEEALYRKNFDLLQYDMLPKVLASAGYSNRSSESGGTSISLLTGRESLEPSTSQERSRLAADASFSWNLLDFGLSYYKAKQQADQYLIAEERRRKVIQNVVQDVRTAYFRALAAQKLVSRCDELLQRVDRAMTASGEVERTGLNAPASALQYQRSLLDTMTLLVQKRRELALAKTELAALMNLPPGAQFDVADRPLEKPLPMPKRLDRLEGAALRNRPELREEDYKARISEDEAKRLILGVLPGIEFGASLQYDSNKYLYNNRWADAQIRSSWNILRLLSLSPMLEMNRAQEDVNKIRRAALTMAVLTQVRISAQRYDMSLYDYDLATRTSEIDEKLLKHSQSGARAGTENELEVIRANTRSLLSEIQKYGAYANVQASYARMLNSIGLDLAPVSGDGRSVARVAGLMRESFTKWDETVVGLASGEGPADPKGK
jgi:outer membrane protein TolC